MRTSDTSSTRLCYQNKQVKVTFKITLALTFAVALLSVWIAAGTLV